MARIIDLQLAKGKMAAAELTGCELLRAEHGEALVEMVVAPGHMNPVGTLMGGLYGVLMDMAMGMALFSVLGDDEAMATMELKINYFRPAVLGDRLVARGYLVNRSAVTNYLECEVHNAAGKLVAKASSTCYTLRGERAAQAFAFYDK